MQKFIKSIPAVFAAIMVMLLTTGVQASEKGSMMGSDTGMASEAVTYDIDGSHSTLGFAVKHLQVGTTRGGFLDYAGTVTFDPNNFESFSADVTIQTASIDTKNKGRDDHLKSGDFFDAAGFPTITFKSERLEKRGEGQVIVGDLTIKDVTKTVTIPVSLMGPVNSPFGPKVIGIKGQTFINRQDFNVSWSKTMDNGGLVVDDTVNLIIEIEAAK